MVPQFNVSLQKINNTTFILFGTELAVLRTNAIGVVINREQLDIFKIFCKLSACIDTVRLKTVSKSTQESGLVSVSDVFNVLKVTKK